MATTAQLQIWLDEAEVALHALHMGNQIVQTSGEGRTVIYKPSDIGRLEAYIATLKNKISAYGRAPVVFKL